MSKHTPGPWDRAQVIHTKACRIGTRARPVCDVLPYKGEPTPEDNANARLIAAAPDMYEALKGMLEDYEDQHGQGVCDCDTHVPVCNSCLSRAALAKATHQEAEKSDG